MLLQDKNPFAKALFEAEQKELLASLYECPQRRWVGGQRGVDGWLGTAAGAVAETAAVAGRHRQHWWEDRWGGATLTAPFG